MNTKMHNHRYTRGRFLAHLLQTLVWSAMLPLSFVACRKDPLPLPLFRELPAPVSSDLTSLWFTDSLHGYATAGTPWMYGMLLSTAEFMFQK